jgi:hypothetical protein
MKGSTDWTVGLMGIGLVLSFLVFFGDIAQLIPLFFFGMGLFVIGLTLLVRKRGRGVVKGSTDWTVGLIGIGLVLSFLSAAHTAIEGGLLGMGLCVIGLALLARKRRRDVVWCALGLVPFLGPIAGLVVLRQRSETSQPESEVVPPPLPAIRLWKRILRGLAVLVVVPGVVYLTLLAEHQKSARVQESGRMASAHQESRRAVEQAERYRHIYARNPVTIARLNIDLPETDIAGTDPWGRPWLVSPAFQDTRTPPNPGDLWVCSRGPAGTGPCPPTHIPSYAGPLDGSIGYSKQFGGWQGLEARWQTWLSGAILNIPPWLPIGYIIAYLGYRIGRALLRRPRQGPWSVLEALYVVCLLALLAGLAVARIPGTPY